MEADPNDGSLVPSNQDSTRRSGGIVQLRGKLLVHELETSSLIRAIAMDRLRCLQVFIEVARDGSFTRAAQRLGMSRANVTKHVAWLEESFRARLLNRTTQHVSLTEAGLSALRSGRLLLERYDDIETAVRESVRGPKGVIRVGTPPSFGTHHLLPLVSAFTLQYPEVQVALSLDDGSTNLVSMGLDLSVRIAATVEDASYIAHGAAPLRPERT